MEKIYQTLKSVFEHISKHLEVRQKYSAARRIFNSLLGVWRRVQTRSFVFDILHPWIVIGGLRSILFSIFVRVFSFGVRVCTLFVRDKCYLS